jgi:predicted GNAT family acetyltransferase
MSIESGVNMLSAFRHQDPQDFLARVGKVLRAEEARYSLILGICNRLINDTHEYGVEDPWFLTLEDDAGVAAFAMRTPPFDVLVASFSGDAALNAKRLVRAVSDLSNTIPGVIGEPEIADAFARTWCEIRYTSIRHTMQQRVYSLSKVKPIELSPGTLRQARPEDRDLVTRWIAGFQEDTFGSKDEDMVKNLAAKMLERGDVFLWEDGDPVSVAARTRPAGNGITIGMVYTPPDLRGRGYASSCVATLCRLLLDSGCRYCTLYTDLSNPTSNKIYKRIGFEEVCDSVQHTFSIDGATDGVRPR